MRPTILHWCFTFEVIRFTGYGVITEKPRVSHLPRIFPSRNNYALDRKMIGTFLNDLDVLLSPCKVWGRSYYARRL